MLDLTTAVTNISMEDLDKMFEEPASQSDVKVIDPNKQDNNNPKIGNEGSLTNVPVVEDIDSFLGGEGAAGTSGDANTSSTSGTEGTSGTSAQANTSGTAGTSAQADTSGTSGTAATSAESSEQVNEILTNTVKFLVQKGLFKDFEGREDMKFTEDVYADLVEQQIESIVNERYNDKKKSAGEYGEAILDYIEKGGDADQVIDLFKEQKAIQEFDISTEDSARELIAKFYKEEYGWKADRIKKTIEGLAAEDGAIDAEAAEIKTKYTANYKAQLQQMREQQIQFEQDAQKRQKQFETTISETISKTKDLDETRRKLIKDSLFKQKKLSDGTVANDLYIKLAQIQANPADYVEFAEFVIDKAGYLKRKELEYQNKAVDKKFQFVKGGSALDKNKGSHHQQQETPEDTKHQGTNFKFALR